MEWVGGKWMGGGGNKTAAKKKFKKNMARYEIDRRRGMSFLSDVYKHNTHTYDLHVLNVEHGLHPC